MPDRTAITKTTSENTTLALFMVNFRSCAAVPPSFASCCIAMLQSLTYRATSGTFHQRTSQPLAHFASPEHATCDSRAYAPLLQRERNGPESNIEKSDIDNGNLQ